MVLMAFNPLSCSNLTAKLGTSSGPNFLAKVSVPFWESTFLRSSPVKVFVIMRAWYELEAADSASVLIATSKDAL